MAEWSTVLSTEDHFLTTSYKLSNVNSKQRLVTGHWSLVIGQYLLRPEPDIPGAAWLGVHHSHLHLRQGRHHPGL